MNFVTRLPMWSMSPANLATTLQEPGTSSERRMGRRWLVGIGR